MLSGIVCLDMIRNLGATENSRPYCLAVLLQLLVALVLLACAGGCGLIARAPAEQPQPAPPGLETAWQGKPVPYKVRIKVQDGPDSLAGQMKASSQRVQLAK